MVHQYKLNGYNIVLDTCSGAVHVVDEVAYDMIAAYKEKTEEEIVAEMLAKYGDREDVTEEDIENFIIECIEQIKNSYDQTDDEFMRIMFNTFIEKVDVGNEKITIHIRMDFSIMHFEVANEQLSGVIHSLPTSKIEKVIKRKKHVHGRNN